LNVVKIMDVSAKPSLKDSGVKQVDGDFLQQFDRAVKDVAKDAMMGRIAENENAQPAEPQEMENVEMPKLDDAQQMEDGDVAQEAADPQNVVMVPAVVIVPDAGTTYQPAVSVNVEPPAIGVVETPMNAEMVQTEQIPVAANVTEGLEPAPYVEQAKQAAVEISAKEQQETVGNQAVSEKQAMTTGATITADEPETAQIVQQTLKEAEEILKQQLSDPVAGSEGLKTAEEKQTVIPVEHAEESEQAGKDTQKDAKETMAKPMTAHVADNGKVEFIKTPAPVAEAEPVQQKESVINQIVERVTTSVSKEKSEFYMQLKPEHLGGLSILLASDEKGLVAKLMTASKEVQSMIQNDMVAMQEALKAKGVNVVHMEVIYDQMASATGKENPSEGQKSNHQMSRGIHGGIEDIMIDGATMFYDEMTMYEVLTEQGGSVEFKA